MNMEKKKLAIIGFGGMGSQHARIISESNLFNIVGIFDSNVERREYAKSINYFTYTSLEELLGDEKVEIVLIATPNDLHKPIAIAALNAGKNVICEKPVTTNAAELEEILKVANKTGKLFVVHQNRRWDEDFLTVKKIVDENLIGEISRIETRVQGSRGIPGDWRQKKAFGGGMMLDWGVHLLDRLLLMINEKIKSVYCSLSYVLNTEVDDGFTLFLKFESGKTAVIEVGTNNYITLPKWYVVGKKGSAIIEDWDMNGKVSILCTSDDQDALPIVAGAGFTKTMAPRIDNSIVEQELPKVNSDVKDFYRNVINVIDGKEEQIVKNCQVLRVMHLIDAAFESAEKGIVIDFEK